MADFVLSPEARADLISIWRYSADRWNEEQADHYLRKIDGVFATIARRPSLGRPCDDIRSGYFRIKAGSHVVFFKTAGTDVFIVRVLHQSQDFIRHL